MVGICARTSVQVYRWANNATHEGMEWGHASNSDCPTTEQENFYANYWDYCLVTVTVGICVRILVRWYRRADNATDTDMEWGHAINSGCDHAMLIMVHAKANDYAVNAIVRECARILVQDVQQGKQINRRAASELLLWQQEM